jgi:hypothetical protein
MSMERSSLRVLPGLLGLVASISVVQAIDKDKGKFNPGPASSFESKQTNNDVTIGAMTYETEALAKNAFGKMNPYAHGILPVLIVIQNDSKVAIRLEQMRAEYITSDRERIDATPSRDVPYLRSPHRPTMVPSPIPGIAKRPKNPLGGPEIEGRAFSAKMLPPGESAFGFFYFQTGHNRGGKIYLTGLQEAPTGKELLYFELPLDTH